MSRDSPARTRFCWMANLSTAGPCSPRKPKGITSSRSKGLGEHPEQGWRKTEGLHPLQQAFVESGAIQCGYCTPAQILAAKALLDRTPNPSEEQVRDAIAGVLCRCTGYLKPVQAVLKAAAVMRGDEPVNWDRSTGIWEAGAINHSDCSSQVSIRPVDHLSGRNDVMPKGGRHAANANLPNRWQARKESGCDQTGAGQTCLHRRY